METPSESFENLLGRMDREAPTPQKTADGSGIRALADFARPAAPAPEQRAQGDPGAPPPSLLERFTQRLAEGAEDQPPGSPEGYNFDGVKDLPETDAPHFQAFREIALEAGLSKRQAATIAEKFYEHSRTHNQAEITRLQAEADRQQKEIQETNAAIEAQLQSEWGDEHAVNTKLVNDLCKSLDEKSFQALVRKLLLQHARGGM